MTRAQMKKLAELFDGYRPIDTILHHGDCIGADAEAHEIAFERHFGIVIHPPENHSKRAWKPIGEIRPRKPYLARNRDIVLETDFLVACPFEMKEQLRSGTWSTVRYAKKLAKPVIIIYLDGSSSKIHLGVSQVV